jgi:hypothetical protein
MILLAALSTAAAAGLPRAGTCGACHTSNFDGWSPSAHARSTSSDEFRIALKRYLADHDTDDGGFCFRCHAPTILISGGSFKATRELLMGRSSRDSVTCVACHSIESIKDGRAIYDPGDSRAYHRVRDLRSIKTEQLCRTCHSAYKPGPRAEADREQARPAGFISRLLGSADSSKKIDHGFPGVVVTSTEDGSCPGTGG